MSSFSTTLRRLAAGLLCLVPLALAGTGSPSRADGIYGGVFAPQKRASKAPARPPVATPGSDVSPALVPLQQQQVDICTIDGKDCRSEVTDSAGYFEFDGLKGGTYRLKTRGSDGKLLDNQIEVSPGQFKELSVIAK